LVVFVQPAVAVVVFQIADVARRRRAGQLGTERAYLAAAGLAIAYDDLARLELTLVDLAIAVVVSVVAALLRQIRTLLATGIDEHTGERVETGAHDAFVGQSVAVIVGRVALLVGDRAAAPTGVAQPFIGGPVAVIVHAIADLVGCRSAATACVQRALVDCPIAVFVDAITDLLSRRDVFVDYAIAVIVSRVADLGRRRAARAARVERTFVNHRVAVVVLAVAHLRRRGALTARVVAAVDPDRVTTGDARLFVAGRTDQVSDQGLVADADGLLLAALLGANSEGGHHPEGTPHRAQKPYPKGHAAPHERSTGSRTRFQQAGLPYHPTRGRSIEITRGTQSPRLKRYRRHFNAEAVVESLERVREPQTSRALSRVMRMSPSASPR